MDTKLRMKRNVARAAASAMKECMALKRLRGLHPRAMRQLYMAVVVPKMDYAVSVWRRQDETGSVGPRGLLDPVQRLAAKAVVSAFRTVSTAVLEAEAGLLPTDTRLKLKLLKHTVNLHTLPDLYPLLGLQNPSTTTKWQVKSPLGTLLEVSAEEIGRDTQQLETIEPFCVTPYDDTVSEDMITIEADRTEAAQQAKGVPLAKSIFTDVSGRNGLLGIGIMQIDEQGRIVWSMSETLRKRDHATIYAAELTAIKKALALSRADSSPLAREGLINSKLN